MPDPDLAPLAAHSAALAHLAERAARMAVPLRTRRRRLTGIAIGGGLAVSADEALPSRGGLRTEDGGEAAVVGRDPSTDIALLRIDGLAAEGAVMEGAKARAGTLVAVAGMRDGAPVARFGTVAHAGPDWRSVRGGAVGPRIELDLDLPHELEGAPAVAGDGNLLGMAVPGARGQVLVIPAATIARVARQLDERGNIPRGYLGLSLHPVREEDGGMGLRVEDVEPGGPGARAGVRRGDVILGMDGAPLGGMRELARTLGPDSVGRAMALDIRRGGERIALELTVGERAQW